jgi:hypothetical protein
MTPQLRRLHRYTWYVLAVALPLGWIAAIRAIPPPVWQTPVRPAPPAAWPVVVASRTAGPYLINLRAPQRGPARQVEITITRPQTSAGTLVYLARPGEEALLGALQTRGVYRFALDSAAASQGAFGLRFVDPIKKQLLREVAFE